MAHITWGTDRLEVEIQAALRKVVEGAKPRDCETQHVDFKEESGRRKGKDVLPGKATSEGAAEQLAAEAACMANTPGGGALIVGFADDGQIIGTELEAEWLKHQIYQKTSRRVTADIREEWVPEPTPGRILIIKVVEALEPVSHAGKTRWRVQDHCEPVDTASLIAGRLYRLGRDWSADASGTPLEDASPVALEIARDYLREAGHPSLAAATDRDLLQRLNVTTPDGQLTNAGVVLFVGRDAPSMDYIRRDRTGGDSQNRIRKAGRGLIQDLREIQLAIDASNPQVHLGEGLARRQQRQLPANAVREAMVNGVVHRDWMSPEPTVVEHIGASLVVTSPGGFVGSVNPRNIITHPSQPRYRSLAEAMAALHIAEREGIGVDRMMSWMIQVGYKPPTIEEVAGPSVRTALVGGRPDEDWLQFLDSIQHADAEDLNILLVLRRLVEHGWVDEATAAVVTQRSTLEAQQVLQELAGASLTSGDPVITRVKGTPANLSPAWRLSNPCRKRLADRLQSVTGPNVRADLAVDWARSRGRVSTTELADLAGVAVNAVSPLLRTLEEDGVLEPSRGNRTGSGFHYLWAGPTTEPD